MSVPYALTTASLSLAFSDRTLYNTPIMFDYRIAIVLVIGLAAMYLLSYDCTVLLTPKVLYWLLPLGLGLIILASCVSITLSKPIKMAITISTIILVLISIYVFLRSRSKKYGHVVYTTSIKVVWIIVIASTLIYWSDPQRAVKMGLLRAGLLLGLFASIYLIPAVDANLLPDQVLSLKSLKDSA
ncbi:Hypothetical protein MVR_LOCUS153 [uncultured virus]|nr:Hypothetical protein MVR_LOCUS153 [uncultured virus]